MGQPVPQRPIFRNVVMDEDGEQTGFADEDLLAPLAVAVEPRGASLSGSGFQVARSSRGLPIRRAVS